MKKGYKKLLEEANAEIMAVEAAEAMPENFVFFYTSGWHSAFATKTVQGMGSHLAGGFTAWKAGGGAVGRIVSKK